MNAKELYEMELHEEKELWHEAYVTRVPGGWVYWKCCENGTGGFDMASVFVPYHNEFQAI